MKINSESDKPLFVQIAEQIEENIFSKVFGEETQIPSTTELSLSLSINPNTVLKGMNMLVDDGILYKKRGIGMFVSEGAVNKIREKKQSEFYNLHIQTLIKEAEKLEMGKEELIEAIERGYNHEAN